MLNVSTTATRRLTIDNDWVQFNARFAGVSQEVSVPIAAVSGIFAKETGYGFAFAMPKNRQPRWPRPPRRSRETSRRPAVLRQWQVRGRPKARPSHLQVIK